LKTSSDHNRFIELRAKGWSYQKIADEIGVAKQTLINWSKKHQLEIANLRAIEIDALQSQYGLTTAGRMQMLGGILQRANEELKRRDFSNIPPHKLVDLVLKICSTLDCHHYQQTFAEERIEVEGEQIAELAFRKSVDKWNV
jgi:transcriptional regulator with XRE-family HTH domain